jgi:hypothetical protein
MRRKLPPVVQAGGISREGSVELRRALIDLGIGRPAPNHPSAPDLGRPHTGDPTGHLTATVTAGTGPAIPAGWALKGRVSAHPCRHRRQHGHAKFTTSTLTVGSHAIRAVYLGTPGCGGSTPRKITKVVQPS